MAYKYSKFNYWFHSLPSEEALRKKIIVPLFKKMGNNDVRDNHGPFELGKDIVCWKANGNEKKYIAAVIKKGDISAAETAEVIRQVNQCLGIGKSDPSEMKTIKIEKVYVITDGAYVGSAELTLVGTFTIYKELGKEVEIWDGECLEEKCEEYLKYDVGRVADCIWQVKNV